MSNSYDEKSYESFAYSLTFPEHLQTIGTLFGLKPAPYKKAKILELGCASGGNIIPIASHFPGTRIVGIDLSAKQIDQGQTLIKALGLTNITLTQQSILDFNTDETFDYIICHGVYSWVNEEVRDKILSLCQSNLAQEGIACISYNTLPCWNMVMSVRDMMQYHIRFFETAEEKVEQSRILLNFLVKGLEDQKTPYANFLRNEIKIVANSQDYYIYHEYLEDENHPQYFYQFVEDSNKHHLSYLADSHLPSMYPGNLKPSFVTKLNEINDVVQAGQYMDFIRNQRFRTTLLCHKDRKIDRQLRTQDVENFCLSYSGKFQKDLSEKKLKSNETMTFESQGLLLTVTNPLFKACIKILHDRFGKPMAYQDLVKAAMNKVGEKDKAKAQKALNEELNIMRMVLAGLFKLHLDEGEYADNISSSPKTTLLIRELSKHNSRVPNLRHESLLLQPVERMILQYLDGQHSHTDIFKDIEHKIKKGEVQVTDEKGKAITEQAQIKKRVPKITLGALESLVKKAYLVA